MTYLQILLSNIVKVAADIILLAVLSINTLIYGDLII